MISLFGLSLPVVPQVPARAAEWERGAGGRELIVIACADRLGYRYATCSDHMAVAACSWASAADTRGPASARRRRERRHRRLQLRYDLEDVEKPRACGGTHRRLFYEARSRDFVVVDARLLPIDVALVRRFRERHGVATDLELVPRGELPRLV